MTKGDLNFYLSHFQVQFNFIFLLKYWFQVLSTTLLIRIGPICSHCKVLYIWQTCKLHKWRTRDEKKEQDSRSRWGTNAGPAITVMFMCWLPVHLSPVCAVCLAKLGSGSLLFCLCLVYLPAASRAGGLSFCARQEMLVFSTFDKNQMCHQLQLRK